jgi:predicted dehydrogenase
MTALCDRNVDRMGETCDALGPIFEAQGAEFLPNLYDDGLALIADPSVDLVVITSVTDTHRQFAVPALRSGKKVYCDKPLAHNAEQAVAIVEAEAGAASLLMLGFTRRYETPWRRAFAMLEGGAIGDLTMVQVRDIIPYHRYLMAWWRRRRWSGGALSDKGCHLFDVFNWFARATARRVHAFGSRSVVTPDPEAPFRCSACDRDCAYRRRGLDGQPVPDAPDLIAHLGPSWLAESEEKHMDDVCIYRPGSDLYHNGTVHFSYDSGVIASYLYSIFGPKADDQETLELVGTSGRLILTRGTGTIDLVRDRGATREVIDCRGDAFRGTHFGADQVLVHEMRDYVDGALPCVSGRDGLEATRMAMAALRSMDRGGATVEMSGISDARV